jgi:hypothetical protein
VKRRPDLCVINMECEMVVVSVLRSVARRRLAERQNPSVCATVN